MEVKASYKTLHVHGELREPLPSEERVTKASSGRIKIMVKK